MSRFRTGRDFCFSSLGNYILDAMSCAKGVFQGILSSTFQQIVVVPNLLLSDWLTSYLASSARTSSPVSLEPNREVFLLLFGTNGGPPVSTECLLLSSNLSLFHHLLEWEVSLEMNFPTAGLLPTTLHTSHSSKSRLLQTLL